MEIRFDRVVKIEFREVLGFVFLKYNVDVLVRES